MKKNDNDSSTVPKPRNLETGRAITHKIDLFQAMHEGAVVLTPNNRLSQHLLLNYGKLYRQPHQGPLVKPQCLSYESWLQQVYHHLIGQISHPTPNLLISNHQERFLWKNFTRILKPPNFQRISHQGSGCVAALCGLGDCLRSSCTPTQSPYASISALVPPVY